MRKEPPKPRKRQANANETATAEAVEAARVAEAESAAREVEAAANDDRPIESFGHPIFGKAKVATVLLAKVRYRSGNVHSPPIRLGLGPIDPAALLDPTQLLPLHGPGRFDLRALDANGILAHPPIQVDVPDENGEVTPYLTAPMTGQSGAVPSGGAGAPGGVEAGPARPDAMVEVWRDIAKAAEAGRSNDINAFMQLIQAERSKGAGAPDTGVVTLLQGELANARATLRDTTKLLDDTRAELARVREQLLRKSLSGGSDTLLEKGFGMLMERLGGGPMAPVPASLAAGAETSPAAGAVEAGGVFEMPSAAALRAALVARQVPMAVIVQAVKLRAAGALDDELWSIVEPVATMGGLL